MDSLLYDIVQYLREQAIHLIDPDNNQFMEPLYVSCKKSSLFMPGFKEVESLVALLPQMLLDLEYETVHRHTKYNVYSPAKAKPSKNPKDFWYSDQKLIPKVWKRPVAEIDPKPYEWLLGLLMYRLIPYMERTFQQFSIYEDDIKSNREGISSFARDDDMSLGHYFKRINHAVLIAKKTAYSIQSNVSDQFLLSDSPPVQVPSSPAWFYALELIKRFYKPERYAKDSINQLLSAPIDVASLPFLYQRYVGLRIVESLQLSGWKKTTENELIACFIGGAVEFTKGSERLSLWCEPRLSKNHPSGFTSAHAEIKFEQTPDYLLVKSIQNGMLEGYILDATLQSSRANLTLKATKYIATEKSNQNRGVQQQKMVKIAGCKAIRKPLRSWVVSPNFNQYSSSLLSNDGIFGIIPLNPRNYSSTSLDLFIEDI